MMVLTFIVSKLQIMVHSGHEFLHKVATNIRHQVPLTLHLTPQCFYIGICGERGQQVG